MTTEADTGLSPKFFGNKSLSDSQLATLFEEADTDTGLSPTFFGNKSLLDCELVMLFDCHPKASKNHICALRKLSCDPSQSFAPFRAAMRMLRKQNKIISMTRHVNCADYNLLVHVMISRNIAAMNVIFWCGVWGHFTQTGNAPYLRGMSFANFTRSEVRSTSTQHELKILSEQEESVSDFLKAARVGDSLEVKRLLRSCPNKERVMLVRKRDNQGNTVLHHACASGNAELVQFLLIFACNREVVNQQKNNLLHMAVLYSGSPAILKTLLLQNAVDVKDKNSEGKTPAMLCAETGAIDMLKTLRRYGGATVVTPDLLGIAASKGCLSFVKYCINQLGLDVLHVDGRGCNILHHACLQERSTEMLAYLLNNANDIDDKAKQRQLLLARDHQGRTLMHICCESGKNPDTLMLVGTKARQLRLLQDLINAQDFYTGLDTLILVTGRDRDREAFHYVQTERHLTSRLVENVGEGKTIDVSKFGKVVKSGWGYPSTELTKSLQDRLFEKGKMERKNDATALHVAVYLKKYDHVKTLLELGAMVNVEDAHHILPVQLGRTRLPEKSAILEALFRAGSDV